MLDLNSPSSSLTYLACFISFFFFLFYFFFFFTKPYKNKNPCPESYPLIGNLPGFLRNRHRFYDWVAELLSQTPSSTLQVNTFFSLSGRGICTANPINIQHLLLSNFPNYIKGSRQAAVLADLLGDGIFNADGNAWTLQRKIASHQFNTKSLKHFISQVVKSEISERLLPFLLIARDEEMVIDLQKVLENFSFNNICIVAFGVDPSSMEKSFFVEAFNDAVEICSERFLSPSPVLWKVKRFFNVERERQMKLAIEAINEYAMEIIISKEKKKAGDENQDLLSRFMSVSSEMEFKDRDEKRKFLRDIVISFILAGKDSTSTALTWFFWLIAGNPRCACAIRAELDSFAPASSNEQGSSRIFSYDELKKLNYLQAALSESMRLFPPVPINSRSTVDDDVLPDGTRVGKGWFADYSAYAMGRMEKLWGPDCREFKPERWLDDGVFQPCDQFKFPVFHGGPRMCLGKEMAYVQMKSIVATVMNEFDIEAVDGGASPEKMMNPPYTISLVLKMRGGFSVRIKRRQEKENS